MYHLVGDGEVALYRGLARSERVMCKGGGTLPVLGQAGAAYGQLAQQQALAQYAAMQQRNVTDNQYLQYLGLAQLKSEGVEYRLDMSPTWVAPVVVEAEPQAQEEPGAFWVGGRKVELD